MIKIHVVIGDRDVRKTSTLRCLTGAGNPEPLSKIVQIADAAGNPIDAVVRLSSLQEMEKDYVPPPLKRSKCLTPKEFVSLIFPENINVVIALRVKGDRYCPDTALDYLDEVNRKGWSVVNVALLGDTACAPAHEAAVRGRCGSAHLVRVPALPSGVMPPSNEIASQVRPVWQWS